MSGHQPSPPVTQLFPLRDLNLSHSNQIPTTGADMVDLRELSRTNGALILMTYRGDW